MSAGFLADRNYILLKERGFGVLAFVSKIVSIRRCQATRPSLSPFAAASRVLAFATGRCAHADALGLKGWVRNEPDGSVTALVGGADDAVTKMLDLFWTGPRSASVASVTIELANPSALPAGFTEIR